MYQDKDRTSDAKKQLQWVIDKASDEGYVAMARLRLAGMLIQENAYDAARQQLTAQVPTAFAPLMADRLGDLAVLESKPEQALQHYKAADWSRSSLLLWALTLKRQLRRKGNEPPA